ncbi:flagellar hook-basal body complex protein FliE [Neorhizobium sp. P12A]|jgi:flagellar hook-basal body complex protein FliE|uniref:flagellar hook-basal body complex protein FliE n=1 Tax=Rhizobium/Agrobacterium group TaxID=227290 RepID=UPI00105275DF|nr:MULTISPECIES: flagellar hook-basal body complex protein FliE [Rhizobium/Agrobacterium group]KAA0699506.1 flagellar hook-basal body complex protein FliE [Neorhizobium sp. P12A]TCR91106.1 flagellar hook-basal body complex protein FliE [Rhizobium sp. BK376]
MIDAIKSISSLSMTRGLGNIATDDAAPSQATGLIAPGLATPGMAKSDGSNGQSFASVLGNVANNMVGDLKQAENASFAGIKGTMDTRKVVDAVMQANQSLQTAMAFRDKLVSAWQDITKMTI